MRLPWRFLVVCLLFLTAAGCGSLLRLEPPVREAAPAEAVKTPKVGLVLGGGAARGFAHVGVIRVLDREKIPIDIIVGTSVGSLVGAIYADKANGAELESISFSLGERDLFDYTFVNPTQGLVRGDRLEEFVAKKLSAREIQQLKLPFAAVATDIQRGEAVVLKSGSVARAVRASSAIPGIFFPVRHQGRLLVDGGVIDNVPASVAREMGADIVIAVSLAAGKRNSQVNNAFDAIMQSLNLMAAQIMERRLKEADVLIQPQVTQYGPVDFSRKKELASAGVRAAEEALPRIREALQNGGLAAR